ncbi:MAG: SMP-30/gluconolactonase/LRE family protein [Planctomycetaceae bacterium]|nr:SMP-30/gluconolactonase/LRE family protein [Planctomycetaceae bacterium]
MIRSATIHVWTGLIVLSVSTASAPGEDASDIVPADARLEEVWNEGEFTEGVAAGPDGMIYFSDIPKEVPGRVLKFDPQTGTTVVHCADSGKSNGLMFDPAGRLLAACGANEGRRALCEVKSDGTMHVLAERFHGKRFNSPNDLVIARDGTVYFSDPRYVGSEPVELDLQSVYRWHPESGEVERLKTGVTKPNGVMLSPDEQTLYVAETDNGTLDGASPPPEGTKLRMTLNAFPLHADGSLGSRRVLVDFGQKLGTDGMTVDAEGRIYAAVRSDDRYGIRIYSPEGKELASIPTPSLPTNCCFGTGDQASMLYVTAGGGLYRIRLRTRGASGAQ